MTHKSLDKLRQHGGKRKGAGRKPSPFPLVFVGVRLTQQERDYVRALGNGSITAGIRIAIAGHTSETERQTDDDEENGDAYAEPNATREGVGEQAGRERR